MRILAIDPGPRDCAVVFLGDDGGVHEFEIADIGFVVGMVSSSLVDRIAIEMIASYGMPVGEEIFETCVNIGRLLQAANVNVERYTRLQVKTHLCKSAKANDSNIRQALIDRYGGSSAIKKGGPLYKVSKDVWAALAVAVTALDGVKPKWNTKSVMEQSA